MYISMYKGVLVSMPRYSRPKSATGIYHVMLRGVNRMNIFYYKEDKLKFLDTLIRMKSNGEYILYGYCIMNNHVHLLIKEEEEPLSKTMKRIGVSYSLYYNKKYERVGHLFQNRFRSECIETDGRLLACLRYIHNNPVEAHMVKDPSAYPWSSYNIYINKMENKYNIISPELILDIFSENRIEAVKKFIDFSRKNCDRPFIDLEEVEEKSKSFYMKKTLDILEKYNLNIEDVAKLKDRNIRNQIIKEIHQHTNMSTREMANIIGWSKSTIDRVLKE